MFGRGGEQRGCASREANLPPGTKPIHEGKTQGKLFFVRIHAGPVFALAECREIF